MGLFSLFKSKEVHNPSAQYRLDPTLEIEKQVGEQIYNALQGPVVEEVLHQLKTTSSESDAYWRSNMEGHSLKVEADLLPDLYLLCQEVKQALSFESKVDFYITGNTDINAFSVASEDADEPNIVNINSGLLTLMTTDELRFVIGHELGHLINKDTALSRLIGFIFPNPEGIPVSLQYKIRLHSQLAELVADRYGFMACGKLDACVTAFFKLASGLDLAKMNVSIDALLADNSRRLNYFLNERGLSRNSHPVNPIRVQAINLFAKSATNDELKNGMNELIGILLRVSDGELDEYVAQFVATAGLIVASADSEITKEEVDDIVSQLASFKMFPRQYLDEVAKGDVNQLLTEAIENILRLNPSLRDGLLGYMISIVMSDKKIDRKEVELLYDFGNSIGYSQMEVAHAVAEQIQQRFVPSLDAMC